MTRSEHTAVLNMTSPWSSMLRMTCEGKGEETGGAIP